MTEIAVALLFKPHYFVVLLKEPVITVFYKVRRTVIFKRCSEGMFSIKKRISSVDFLRVMQPGS